MKYKKVNDELILTIDSKYHHHPISDIFHDLHLSKKTIHLLRQYKQYRFLLPPLELQNKISTLATNLDNLICKEGNLLSQIEQVKIALLQQLFI